MPQDEVQSLPFLTRKMLAFEHATTFSLRLEVQARAVTNVTVRGMTREGPFTFNIILDSVSTIQTFTYRIPDIPIMVSVEQTTLSLDQGRIYASVSLLVNGVYLQQLCSGLVYWSHGISYPSTFTPDSRPNGGEIRIISTANPAAGAQISQSVPSGETWKIKAVSFSLVNAAIAASRRVHIRFDYIGSGVLDFFSDIDQLTGETRKYTCAPVSPVSDSLDDNDIIIPIPADIVLQPDCAITTTVTNMQATDDFGSAVIWAETFFTPKTV